MSIFFPNKFNSVICTALNSQLRRDAHRASEMMRAKTRGCISEIPAVAARRGVRDADDLIASDPRVPLHESLCGRNRVQDTGNTLSGSGNVHSAAGDLRDGMTSSSGQNGLFGFTGSMGACP